MVVQGMKAYEIDIQDPREIQAACDFVKDEAGEDGVFAGLNHDHYSVVRGYSEELAGLDDEIDIGAEYPLEINRQDGGNTWVHSPLSRCGMIAVQGSFREKNHEDLMKQWGSLVRDSLEEFLDYETAVVYREGDLYDTAGNQLAGLSADLRDDDVALFRMCFYEGRGEEHGEEFHALVEKDLEMNEEGHMTDFRERYRPLRGFYDELVSGWEHATVDVEPVESFRRQEDGRDPRYCI